MVTYPAWFPAQHERDAAAADGAATADAGGPCEPPAFDAPSPEARRLLRLCWVSGWHHATQHTLQARYGTPPA